MLQNTFQAALKMVSHAAGKKEVRYYLNGVHLELSSSSATLIATDGHRLAVAEVAGSFQPAEITIGHEAVKQLLVISKSGGEVGITIAEGRAEITIGGQTLSFPGIGGKYPDWRRAAQGVSEATETIGVNADYMAQAMAALSKVANRKSQGVKMHLRGPNSSLKLQAGLAEDFPGLTDAYCIVMPMRI